VGRLLFSNLRRPVVLNWVDVAKGKVLNLRVEP